MNPRQSTELLKALKDLLAQLYAIGVPEWHGAEGLSFRRAESAIEEAEHALYQEQ